ncbi:hypothetical protein [Pseudomonas protegens]|uniref:hypothetical protein n=1 Tax=Pseudomonas protegens TaxID=380021 RepID=UPI00383B52D8
MKVLKHELGHWLIARHLGFTVGDIQITIIKLDKKKSGANQYTHSGSSKVFLEPTLKTFSDLHNYLDQRIQVLYAGVLAQTHGQTLTDEELGNVIALDAKGDQEKIEELSILVRGWIRETDMDTTVLDQKTNEFITESWNKCKASIAELYPTLEKMANELARVYKPEHRNLYKLDQLEILESTINAA